MVAGGDWEDADEGWLQTVIIVDHLSFVPRIDESKMFACDSYDTFQRLHRFTVELDLWIGPHECISTLVATPYSANINASDVNRLDNSRVLPTHQLQLDMSLIGDVPSLHQILCMNRDIDRTDHSDSVPAWDIWIAEA